MNIQIRSFADAGDIEKERMSLRVSANIDLGAYAIFFTLTSSDGKPTAGNKVAYWFPDANVKVGDLVVLYTKSGERRTKELTTGGTAHFFFWGLKKPIWNTPKAGCVLLSVDEWEWKAPDETK